jgi:hypothetical protein
VALAFGIVVQASAVLAEEDEDHKAVCPLLTEELLRTIVPEVTGHGACKTFCTGCGCKGGPGYRDHNGRCVGYANLIRSCGPPPHSGCKAECVPLANGCDHGRVWLKDVLTRAGFSAQFIPATP